MVWIYGGGGTTGSTAEPTYDGNAMAKNGVVVVSMGYRLNVFGWMAHPELTKESEHHSSGNYGSLDQLAGIQWVHNNIAAFGGDPNKVTIWGESGGSRSVNFLDASPMLKGLARGAIAESHTSFGRMTTLAEAEASGVAFAKSAGKNSLAELRAMSASDLIDAFAKHPVGMNAAIVDGWFLPQDIYTIYSEGKQNDIPLLTGGTNDEGGTLVAARCAGSRRRRSGSRGRRPWSRRCSRHSGEVYRLGESFIRKQSRHSSEIVSGNRRCQRSQGLSRCGPRHQFRGPSDVGEITDNDWQVAGVHLHFQPHPAASGGQQRQSSGWRTWGSGALLGGNLRLQQSADERHSVD